MNWDSSHEILADYVLTTLLESGDLAPRQEEQLKADMAIVLNYDEPNTEDDVFDRIEKAIFDWWLKNRDPICRGANPQLNR